MSECVEGTRPAQSVHGCITMIIPDESRRNTRMKNVFVEVTAGDLAAVQGGVTSAEKPPQSKAGKPKQDSDWRWAAKKGDRDYIGSMPWMGEQIVNGVKGLAGLISGKK